MRKYKASDSKYSMRTVSWVHGHGDGRKEEGPLLFLIPAGKKNRDDVQ